MKWYQNKIILKILIYSQLNSGVKYSFFISTSLFPQSDLEEWLTVLVKEILLLFTSDLLNRAAVCKVAQSHINACKFEASICPGMTHLEIIFKTASFLCRQRFNKPGSAAGRRSHRPQLCCCGRHCLPPGHHLPGPSEFFGYHSLSSESD